MRKRPNQALEPTSRTVMPRATPLISEGSHQSAFRSARTRHASAGRGSSLTLGKRTAVHSYFWFSLRLAIVGCFFASGFTMAKDVPAVPSSGFWVFAVAATALFAGWRFYSILAAQWRQKKEGHDWSA